MVALGRARRAGSTRATTRSPSCSSPLIGSSTSAWSSPTRTTSTHARRAAAVLALDHAVVGDLAAAGGVERRLDELGEHAPVLAARSTPTAVACSSRLVAGEVAGLGRLARTPAIRSRLAVLARRGPGLRARARAAPPSAPRSPARRRPALLGGELERELEREAVGVVQPEGLVGADALLALLPARARSGRRAAACPARACARTPPPRRRATSGSCRDALQLGVGVAHQLAHDGPRTRQEAGARCRAGGPAGRRGA